MTLPVITALINFSTGPGFAQTMILDSGVLDTNVSGFPSNDQEQKKN